jgi:hydroxyacylglutathione hydrolase
MTTNNQEHETTPSSLTVAQFPCLQDNYGYLIHCDATGETAAVDTPEAAAYQAELAKRNWTLTHIFNTHHHKDHTGGNLELKRMGGVTIYGPAKEHEKIPGVDVLLEHGQRVKFGNTKASVIDVGGHTKGHIAFYFPAEKKVFAGDSLFSLGCGRMFEGTPTQFWESLKRLRALPDETTLYW